MHLSNLSLKSLFLSAAVLSSSTSLRADWPQWRGPNRDGLVKTATVPATWPKGLKEEWKITVGAGHASPVESNGKIYHNLKSFTVVDPPAPADGAPLTAGQIPF